MRKGLIYGRVYFRGLFSRNGEKGIKKYWKKMYKETNKEGKEAVHE